MTDHCKEIPVVPYDDGISGPVYSDDCTRFQTERKLYDEVSNDIALISTSREPKVQKQGESGFGTGFFVNDGDEIVTNAHVVTAMPYIQIITKDGEHFPAKIEKLDDINDIALLKVIGKSKDPNHVLKIDNNTSDLRNGDELTAFGYPRGFGQFQVFANPGRYREHGSMLGFIPGKDITQYSDLLEMQKRKEQLNDPVYSREVDRYLNAPRIRSSMAIFGGNSGGPAVDKDGVLVGVMANRVSGARALMIPAEKVIEMLNSKSKFTFDYEIDGDNNHKLLGIRRSDGTYLPPVILPFTDGKKSSQP